MMDTLRPSGRRVLSDRLSWIRSGRLLSFSRSFWNMIVSARRLDSVRFRATNQ